MYIHWDPTFFGILDVLGDGIGSSFIPSGTDVGVSQCPRLESLPKMEEHISPAPDKPDLMCPIATSHILFLHFTP